jgi:hypothetical protein
MGVERASIGQRINGFQKVFEGPRVIRSLKGYIKDGTINHSTLVDIPSHLTDLDYVPTKKQLGIIAEVSPELDRVLKSVEQARKTYRKNRRKGVAKIAGNLNIDQGDVVRVRFHPLSATIILKEDAFAKIWSDKKLAEGKAEMANETPIAFYDGIEPYLDPVVPTSVIDEEEYSQAYDHHENDHAEYGFIHPSFLPNPAGPENPKAVRERCAKRVREAWEAGRIDDVKKTIKSITHASYELFLNELTSQARHSGYVYAQYYGSSTAKYNFDLRYDLESVRMGVPELPEAQLSIRMFIKDEYLKVHARMRYIEKQYEALTKRTDLTPVQISSIIATLTPRTAYAIGLWVEGFDKPDVLPPTLSDVKRLRKAYLETQPGSDWKIAGELADDYDEAFGLRDKGHYLSVQLRPDVTPYIDESVLPDIIAVRIHEIEQFRNSAFLTEMIPARYRNKVFYRKVARVINLHTEFQNAIWRYYRAPSVSLKSINELVKRSLQIDGIADKVATAILRDEPIDVAAVLASNDYYFPETAKKVLTDWNKFSYHDIAPPTYYGTALLRPGLTGSKLTYSIAGEEYHPISRVAEIVPVLLRFLLSDPTPRPELERLLQHTYSVGQISFTSKFPAIYSGITYDLLTARGYKVSRPGRAK